MQLAAPFDATVSGHAHDVNVEVTFDFLNTLDHDDGLPKEGLVRLDDALAFFVDRGVIHLEGAELMRRQTASKPRVAAHDLERVRETRAAMREVADAIAEDRAASPDALDAVNRALHARQVIELAPGPFGVGVTHRHIGDPIDDALARLAEALVLEVTNGHPERIRICANDTCRWIFYDTSRTGQRRWCDMATCGNRAKAARHRARAKGSAAEGSATA